jgi:hypothetical protein
MRSFVLIFALILVVLTGCDKNKERAEFNAHYKGTFIRTTGSPLDDPIVANISLHFTEDTFSGASNVGNYPAICSGNFTISQTKINVVNKCYFTANFDWTLIFKGEYYYEQNGNQLRIWRTYPNGAMDIYQLTKED